ncbi:hypothetical protein Tco_1035295 [Tanacetum coccineum]
MIIHTMKDVMMLKNQDMKKGTNMRYNLRYMVNITLHGFKESAKELLVRSWFNELVDVEDEPKEQKLLNGSVVLFGKCMKKFLNKDKITKEDLKGLTFELLKKRCKNSVELEYNMEQYYLALTNKTDWANPRVNRFHDDLSKPLPLVGPLGRKTIPISYFFNQDLEYL